MNSGSAITEMQQQQQQENNNINIIRKKKNKTELLWFNVYF